MTAAISVWKRLAQRSIDRPQRAITLMVGLTLLAAPGLLRLEMRTDGHALVPPEDPAVRIDAEVRERFGLRDPVLAVVVTDHPDGIYNAETLRRVAELTVELARLDGIGPARVTSLATEKRERLDPGTEVSFRSFLDPLPQTTEAIARLRQDLARPSARILHGTLIAEDGRATAVIAEVPEGELRRAVVQQMLESAQRTGSPADRVLVVGAPVAEVLLGEHILADLTLLLPLALAVISAVLWLGCRRLWGVLLGLIEVGACLIFTLGVMGWMGVPVYLTTAILPVLLTTLGLADEIHIYWHYQHLLSQPARGPHPAAVRTTMEDMAAPVVLTSYTTVIGFLSFTPSGQRPVLWLGIFAGLGVLFCLGWSLTVLPAALALLPPEKMVRPAWRRGPGEGSSEGLMARLLVPLWRHPWLLAGALTAACATAVVGASRLYVYDSWIEGFAPGSAFRRATEEVDRRLAGTHILQLELRFAPPPGGNPRSWSREGPLLDPAAVDVVGELEAFVRRQPGVGGVLGLHNQLSALSLFWQMDRPGRVLPEDPFDLDRLLRRFDLSRGLDERLQVIDEALASTVVTVYVRDANYWSTGRLMRALRDYEAGHLAPRSCRMRFAGDLAVSQAMIPAIVRSQVASVLLSLVAELLMVCALYRSLHWGLLAILPASVSILWVFGFMGFSGIPLGVATSMFCAITLGIGMDFGIHFLERFRQSGQATPFERARAALQETGPAIVGNTLLNALGFGVLAFSRVPANARLGLLVAAALIAACVLTLLPLGALLSRLRELTETGPT